MIKCLKTLFGKHESQKTVELNLGQEKLASDSEEFVEVLPNIPTEQPLHTPDMQWEWSLLLFLHLSIKIE